jgi:branched-chain amino acid transport system permease protein
VSRDRAYFAAAALLFIAALSVCMFARNPYSAQVVVWMALNIVLALGLRFMLLVGEVNLGVGGFFGLGAYTAAICATVYGFSTLTAIALGTLVAGVFSLPFGYITLRVSGHYFMLISFALTEVLRLIYTQSAWLGGNSGLVGIIPGLPAFPALVIVLAGMVFVGLVFLERSHFGRLIRAIADSEAMVRAVGISVPLVKLMCLLVSSLVAGLAGSTFAFANTVIAPGDFGFLLPVFALAYVKIGGQSHPAGTVFGTVLMSLLAQLVIGFGAQDTMLFGSAIVLTMLFMPEGFIGLFDRYLAFGRNTARASGSAASTETTS